MVNNDEKQQKKVRVSVADESLDERRSASNKRGEAASCLQAAEHDVCLVHMTLRRQLVNQSAALHEQRDLDDSKKKRKEERKKET